jgi:hypothetical protein
MDSDDEEMPPLVTERAHPPLKILDVKTNASKPDVSETEKPMKTERTITVMLFELFTRKLSNEEIRASKELKPGDPCLLLDVIDNAIRMVSVVKITVGSDSCRTRSVIGFKRLADSSSHSVFADSNYCICLIPPTWDLQMILATDNVPVDLKKGWLERFNARQQLYRKLSVYEQMLHNERFMDFQIECQDGVRKAHRAILTSVSPYFSGLCNSKMQDGNAASVSLPDITLKSMNYLLFFFYTGELHFQTKSNTVTDHLYFVQLAHYFGVVSLIRLLLENIRCISRKEDYTKVLFLIKTFKETNDLKDEVIRLENLVLDCVAVHRSFLFD